MTSRSDLPASRLGPGFSTRDARALGASRSRLDARDLIHPFWGTRQLASADPLRARCFALLSRLSRDATISHSTAARLWGAPLPRRLEDGHVHVSVPVGTRAPQHRRVAGHQRVLETTDVSVPFGFKQTTPARTWCDLAEQTSLVELVAAGDFLIRWRSPLTTLAELSEYSERAVLRRGRAARRRALGLLSERAESYRESVLRVAIVLAGFPSPAVNHEVRNDRGDFVARVDLAWPEQRVAVEYEGDQHRTDRAQWQRDLRRVEALQDLHWRVIRTSADDLSSPSALFGRLSALLTR